MTEQDENELICEKLLKWKRCGDGDCWEQHSAPWLDSVTPTTPTFANWAEAGLIMDALALGGVDYVWRHDSAPAWHPYKFEILGGRPGVYVGGGNHGPSAIRAAALAWIKGTCP